MGYFTDLQADDGFSFRGYVAEPLVNPIGGLVLLQEIFGVNDHIRSVADSYAAEGYLVVAPATFHRVKEAVELGYSEDDMKEGMGYKAAVEALPAPGVLRDIQAAIEHAAEGGNVGILGYCWGGLLTWRAACTLDGLSAAVPYYGGGMTSEAEMAREPRVPVMAHFADHDGYISMDSIRAFQAAQTGVEVHIYAGHHGFNCDQRGAYNAEAAQLARQRTSAFLAKHLA
ncbi:dienelactone hydrolase family protein [Hydrogenophaga sp.]|uniref:dienelactone hydrolase family protein n=1 Tax=Hydrogenophaga sp. TaxID=1904254 RepID=UPI003569A177